MISKYISEQPKEHQALLNELYSFIRTNYPELKEKISWGMPTFYLKHNIFHFALNKSHLGIYPGNEAIDHFSDEIKKYKSSKGAFQIPFDQKIPYYLISKMIEYNVTND